MPLCYTKCFAPDEGKRPVTLSITHNYVSPSSSLASSWTTELWVIESR
jgi:hypothetical protein